MKLATAAFTVLSSLLHGKDNPLSLDVPRLLRCVVAIEGSTTESVSKSGARGIYQIQPATWAQYSQEPHALASQDTPSARAKTLAVATAHAEWIIKTALPALGLPQTPYSFALLWGPGYGNTQKVNLTAKNVDYSRRFSNLYEDQTFP